MLPGKKYKPEDILRILGRRYWLVLIPFAIISAGTAVVARRLPDVYRSQALVLVVPQRIPEEYVRSTVTTRIEDRLQAITATILSRTRLEQTIEQFNLYAEARRKGIMEDVVQRMRGDIHVEVKSGDAFTVSYDGAAPVVVQKVCDALTSSFISESYQDRDLLAQTTDQFLEGQLEEFRRNLVDQENKLAQYRMEHKGELPSQLEANLQAQAGVQQRLVSTMEAITHGHERRLTLESNIRALEAAAPSETTSPVPVPVASMDATGNVTGGSAAARLALAQKQVNIMLSSGKTELHADVKYMRRQIKALQEEADKEAMERPVTVTEAAQVSPTEGARREDLRATKAALEALDRQTKDLEDTQKELINLNKSYQAKIDAVPQRETEMAVLTRDYSTLQSAYNSMRTKKEDSKIAASLEHRQIGEQFKLLDSARVPQRPMSPNRPLLNTVGVVAGLMVGLGLVAFLEYRDASFSTDEEVTQVLSLPVLAVVPLMQAEPDRRSALRRRVLVSVALGTAVLGCLAVLGYTYVRP